MAERTIGRVRDRVATTAGLAVVGGLAVLITALIIGKGAAAPEGPVDSGPITRWGLPLADLVVNVATVGTVGSLVFGVLLAPSRKGSLRGVGLRAVHRASRWALAWLVGGLAVLFLTLSDFLAVPPGGPAYMVQLTGYITGTDQGRALVLVAALVFVIAVAARWVISLNIAAFLLLLAVAAILPPVFTGHAATAADHDVATSSMLVHVIAMTLWVGGLIAFVAYGRSSTEVVKTAAPRFSALALWCFAATGVSGLVNAWVRLGGLEPLWTSAYGWLVLGKIVALVALGWLGWRHRRHSLRLLAAGQPNAFRRLAAGEVVIMIAAIALAVALSRTAPPLPEQEPEVWTIAESLVGHELPPVTFARLFTEVRPDSTVLMVALLAIVGYVAGVRRMRARGGWPIARTISWVAGVSLAVFVLNGGLATYGPAMFSAHMAQHMTLTMLVPILLALGAPITLALRALPASARGGSRGAREWLLIILHSRIVQLLTNPFVALALYVGTLYGFYFSPLFELAMRSHLAHLVMHVHFIGVGSLYFWPIIGADPMPRRLPHFGRFLLLFASVPFHAFFGVIVMMSSTVIGASWYQTLSLPWVDIAADQNLGGGIAWGAGELPTVIVLIALVFSWWRADTREARRADRRADEGADAELEAYNAHLARLADKSAAEPDR